MAFLLNPRALFLLFVFSIVFVLIFKKPLYKFERWLWSKVSENPVQTESPKQETNILEEEKQCLTKQQEPLKNQDSQ